MKPEVIVLDEPTSFLDPQGAKQIFEVIRNLNKDLGITIVLVEHRLDLTAKYADRVMVMDKGRVVLDNDPREVFSSEEARLLGVGIPKATRLYQFLKTEGRNLGKVPVSSEEAYQAIAEVLNT